MFEGLVSLFERMTLDKMQPLPEDDAKSRCVWCVIALPWVADVSGGGAISSPSGRNGRVENKFLKTKNNEGMRRAYQRPTARM